jgi:hypothetical protein
VQGRVGIELGKGEGTGVALFGPQFHHGELGRVGDHHELGGGERLGVKCVIANFATVHATIEGVDGHPRIEERG